MDITITPHHGPQMEPNMRPNGPPNGPKWDPRKGLQTRPHVPTPAPGQGLGPGPLGTWAQAMSQDLDIGGPWGMWGSLFGSYLEPIWGPIWGPFGSHLGSLLFGAHWAHLGPILYLFGAHLGPFGAHFIWGPFGPCFDPRCYPLWGGYWYILKLPIHRHRAALLVALEFQQDISS